MIKLFSITNININYKQMLSNLMKSLLEVLFLYNYLSYYCLSYKKNFFRKSEQNITEIIYFPEAIQMQYHVKKRKLFFSFILIKSKCFHRKIIDLTS